MKTISKSLSLIGALAVLFVPHSATSTRAKKSECYQIASSDTPIASDDNAGRNEIWCYRHLDSPQGARFVYSVDDNGHLQPELSIMIQSDGTKVHASLKAGNLTVHRMQGDWNPIAAPLTPPKNAKRVPEPISPSAEESVEKGVKLFWEYGDVDVVPAEVHEGEFSASIDSELMPWRGYWFPHGSGRMHNGENSPLHKYDKFIERRTGVDLQTQRWEKARHRYSGLSWSGHCNGWAAASVLRKEPKSSVTDPFTGLTFSVSDLKGLWIERDYCPKLAFFGGRFRGRPDDNPRDIRADTFHNVMTYFIGGLKKPVLMDMMATAPVENRVLSGYKMTVKKIGTNLYQVVMAARVHEYDKKQIDEPGEAPSIEKTYKYTLRTNNEGRVVSGSWISANPDFLWVPLAPGNCKDRNPGIDEFWIEEIQRMN